MVVSFEKLDLLEQGIHLMLGRNLRQYNTRVPQVSSGVKIMVQFSAVAIDFIVHIANEMAFVADGILENVLEDQRL